MGNAITEAFRATPRREFLPDIVVGQATWDVPLPIGFGQTNSQPSTVERMLEWLEVDPGQHILDVGSGSGWTTALLAHLTGSKGDVVAVEIVPELVEFGRDNCQWAGVRNVTFHEAGKTLGYPAAAPYDRILVSAAASELPTALVEQLAPGGQMVIPVRSDILVISKDEAGHLDIQTHPGFAFVPLV
ncbi:MAG: protein-L-isoaspartate O-methyltransferase [Candidatus Saccharimonadales bacterium]